MKGKVNSSNKNIPSLQLGLCNAIPSFFSSQARPFPTPLLLRLMMWCPALWTYKFKRRLLHLVITDSVPRATEGGGSHNSGESLLLTRQNDRAEERPDSRTDLLIQPSPNQSWHTHTQKHTHTPLLGPLHENNWGNQFNLHRDLFQTVGVVSQSTAWRRNNEKLFKWLFVLMFANNGKLGEMVPCVKKCCTHTKRVVITYSGLQVVWRRCFFISCSLIVHLW